MDRIVGREAEMARLRGALDRARAGQAAVAVVTGPPGIGKTALVRAALGTSGPDQVVITATGDEAEVHLDLGVASQLVRRTPMGPDTLAAIEPGPGADAVQVGAAVLALIDRLELRRTLVVVVDDAQWADEASLKAITFVARRVGDDPAMLCVTCRDDAVDRLPPALLRLAERSDLRIDLAPLDRDAVGELAASVYGRPVPSAAVARLHEHAGGNPLHTRALLAELPLGTLTAGGLGALPVPRTYAHLVRAQVASCGDDARALAAALAVLGPAPVEVLAAMAGCAAPRAAVDGLGRLGLVELRSERGGRGEALSFPHGLMRAAVESDLSPSRRAALHAAAARLTEGDEALGHRLEAAIGPDPELVTITRERAAAVASEGSPVAAARLLLAAARLAANPDEHRHLVAVAAARVALAGASVDGLAAQVAECPDGPLRSCVMGRAAVASGDLLGAERLLVDAWTGASRADADDDVRTVAAPVAEVLAILALHRQDGAGVVTWARRALDAGSDSGLAATLGCHGLAIDGHFAEAEREMSAILDGAPPPHLRVDAQLGRGIVRLWANDLEGAAADLAAVDGDRGATRSTLARVNLRSFRAEAAYRTGRWHEALDLAESTTSVVDDAGDPMVVALPHAVAAFVLAGTGHLAEAQAHVDAAAANAARTGLMPARLWSLHAALRLATAAGDHDQVARLGETLVAEGFDALPEGIHRWRATHVDALIALDRVAEAAAVADELADLAERSEDVSLAADAARATGHVAVADGRRDGADEAFAAGLALDPVASRPFERARLELAAGAHQRRAGNRRAAAALLEEASARLAALGATPWSTRCTRELEACGLRPRRRGARSDRDGGLTAQERLVARLAAGGRTNREVAAELLISAKTVEHHLGRVYAKLGIRSRTALAALLLGGDEVGAGTDHADTVSTPAASAPAASPAAPSATHGPAHDAPDRSGTGRGRAAP